MRLIKRPIWTAKPLLVTYLLVVTATVGLLVNRNGPPDSSVPASTGAAAHAVEPDREVKGSSLLMQLFRPSPPTARRMLRTALPTLAWGGGGKTEQRNLLFLWTGPAGERPQSLFQVALPFLRTRSPVESPPLDLGAPPPKKPEPTPVPPKSEPGSPKPPQPVQKPPAQQPPTQQPAPRPPVKESPVLNGGLPLVGIYHTHDWEAFISEFPDLKVSTDQDLIKIASYDHSKKTIVNIGESLAHRLRDLGVTTVHAPFKHQELGYDYAYQSSRTTAKQIMKAAPSVKILMDLHRDGAIELDSTTVINGKSVARVRCVIGGREDLPHWQKNQAFCDALMAKMEAANPGITLPTLTPKYRYNQDLMPGAILLEIGNALNTYDEAERAIGYLAEAMVELIREGAYPK